MGAVLNLPRGEDLRPTIAVVADMAANVQAACRVLTASMVQRLSVMNAAARELRAMGYRVVGQTLFPSYGSRPLLWIDCGKAMTIAPLRARTHGLSRRHVGHHRLGVTEFNGVTVMWEEA